MGRLLLACGLALGLIVASACGVKAPPRPPGVKAATRGDSTPACDGCEIPGPDAYPAPSSPSSSPVGGSAGLPTSSEDRETAPGSVPVLDGMPVPVTPDEEGTIERDEPAPGEDDAEKAPGGEGGAGGDEGESGEARSRAAGEQTRKSPLARSAS